MTMGQKQYIITKSYVYITCMHIYIYSCILYLSIAYKGHLLENYL